MYLFGPCLLFVSFSSSSQMMLLLLWCRRGGCRDTIGSSSRSRFVVCIGIRGIFLRFGFFGVCCAISISSIHLRFFATFRRLWRPAHDVISAVAGYAGLFMLRRITIRIVLLLLGEEVWCGCCVVMVVVGGGCFCWVVKTRTFQRGISSIYHSTKYL